MKTRLIQFLRFLIRLINPASFPQPQFNDCNWSQDFYSLFQKNWAVMLLVDAENGDILDANQAAAHYYGYRLDELKRMTLFQFLATGHEQVVSALHHIKTQGQGSIQLSHKLASGETRDAEILIGTLIKEEKNYLFCVVSDITEKKYVENQLASQDLYFHSLLENINDVISVSNADGTIIFQNPAITHILGYLPEERYGKNYFELVHPDDLDSVIEATNKMFSTSKPVYHEYRLRCKDGSYKLVSGTRKLFHHDDSTFTIVNYHDITESKAEKLLLEGEKLLLERIATGCPLAELLIDIARFVEANASGILCCIMLLDSSGKRLRVGAGPSMPEEFLKGIDGVSLGVGMGSCSTAAYFGKQVIVSDISVDPLWKNVRGFALMNGLKACWSIPILSSKNVLGTLAAYYKEPRTPLSDEISLTERGVYFAGIAIERNLTEERIRYLAHYDTLTYLPNRNLLLDRLNQALIQASRYQRGVGVLFIDLDRFKAINDELGHAAGDQVLQEVALRMTNCVREGDTVSRQGGDEFLVVLPDLHEASDAVIVAKKISNALESPLKLSGNDYFVSASIGVSFYPTDGNNAEMLIKNADRAMYRAKKFDNKLPELYSGESNIPSE